MDRAAVTLAGYTSQVCKTGARWRRTCLAVYHARWFAGSNCLLARGQVSIFLFGAYNA